MSGYGVAGLLWAVMNIFTYCAFALDKRKAVRNRWRIRESHLLAYGFFGGAIGGYLAMQLCRHKTRTPIFRIAMPIMVALQLGVFLLICITGMR